MHLAVKFSFVSTPSVLADTSPIFCYAKHRGGVRKDGGVNPYNQKSYPIFSTPLLKNYRFVGISLITNATQGRNRNIIHRIR